MAKPTDAIRSYAQDLRKEASDLESIADELDTIKENQLIVVEYTNHGVTPVYIGKFNGLFTEITKMSNELRIKLKNVAIIKRPISRNYELLKGEEFIAPALKISAIGGQNSEQLIQQCWPEIYGNLGLRIIQEDKADEVLKKYGFSLVDYKTLFK